MSTNKYWDTFKTPKPIYSQLIFWERFFTSICWIKTNTIPTKIDLKKPCFWLIWGRMRFNMIVRAKSMGMLFNFILRTKPSPTFSISISYTLWTSWNLKESIANKGRGNNLCIFSLVHYWHILNMLPCLEHNTTKNFFSAIVDWLNRIISLLFFQPDIIRET